jgi:hypothetical protein
MSAHAPVRPLNQVVSLFEPDALLPTQYLDTVRRIVPIEPEKRLMWAVLEDAIDSYQSFFTARKPKAPDAVNEAEQWIFTKDERWFFSFDNICDLLGFDAEYLRAGLLVWKEKQLPSGAPLAPPKQALRGGGRS